MRDAGRVPSTVVPSWEGELTSGTGKVVTHDIRYMGLVGWLQISTRQRGTRENKVDQTHSMKQHGMLPELQGVPSGWTILYKELRMGGWIGNMLEDCSVGGR